MCSANDAPEHQFMLDSPCIGKFRQTLIYFSDLAPGLPAGGVLAVARGAYLVISSIRMSTPVR
jgi:hypothetical protein